MCLLQLPIDSMATRTLASNVVSLATLAMSCIHKAHTLLRLKPSFNLHCTPTYVWYILYIEAHNIECACSITYVISVCVCVCVLLKRTWQIIYNNIKHDSLKSNIALVLCQIIYTTNQLITFISYCFLGEKSSHA